MKLKVEYIPINDITPYENNAKIHTPEQIEQIKKSIEEFGMNDPIGIWGKDNIIIEGHGRLMALQELGWDEVPVIRLDDLTDDQRKAYTLIHNQTTMNTGFDLDILNEELANIDLDMSFFGFEEIEEPEIDIKDDDFNIEDIEPIKEPKAKKGDIYKLGNHYLMCGDSTNSNDVEKLMNGAVADLVVTDPPYNVDYSSKNKMLNYSDKGSRIQKPIENDNIENFEAFLFSAYENMVNNTKEGGAFYIFHSEKEDITFKQKLIEAGVYVHQTLIWVKNNFVLGRMDYQPKHEPCLYGWKEGAGHYFIDERNHSSVIEDKIDFDNLKKDEAIQMLKDIYKDGISTTVIHEDKPQVSDLHPTMKPLKLLARLIKNSSKENELVLDLFGGSGSTLITCEQLNRKCYMMEYDPIYIDVIIERWENFTGEKAVLLNE